MFRSTPSIEPWNHPGHDFIQLDRPPVRLSILPQSSVLYLEYRGPTEAKFRPSLWIIPLLMQPGEKARPSKNLLSNEGNEFLKPHDDDGVSRVVDGVQPHGCRSSELWNADQKPIASK